MIKRLPRSLDAKILYIIILALLCALLVYFVAYGLGTMALDRIYMSQESVSARQAAMSRASYWGECSFR